jgi:uncharacterized protein YbbC (DUF1343 family)
MIEGRIGRRAVVSGLAFSVAGAGGLRMAGPNPASAAASRVTTGAAALAAEDFALLAGQRVGLIVNQTGRVGESHLVDLLHGRIGRRLTAILAPEHGFRGKVEAGERVADGRDARTGVSILSLYGATKSPTSAMLAEVDMLLFDIQDIGVRFYTYISTMGLAMQAAARRGIPFVVLDRPNPLGGDDVSGFVLEPALRSFVGQYAIPIVHGLTVGELAAMIKGERLIEGLEALDLKVVPCRGLTRQMRWPATTLEWVATSPNIPTFLSALAYPGIGIVGETLVNEGRGTPAPFTQLGAPWLDAPRLADDLARAGLPGVRFEATRYTPRSIPEVALNPRFLGQEIGAVRLVITDVAAYRPLEVGIHALALLMRQARDKGAPLLPANPGMLDAIAGTTRLRRLLSGGAAGRDIVLAWRDEVERFRQRRQPYLRYPAR